MLAKVSGGNANGDGVAYTWSLDEGSSGVGGAVLNQTAAGGVSCTFTCTAAGGAHTIAVNETSVRSGAVLRSAAFEVHCKYVRREIRELVPRDRELYFDAVEQMHRLTLLEGITLYGQDFRNYETFTIKHLDSRTVTQCTPYHGGNVFLTAHAAFNLEFEQSLQAIHPILAAPYWDYTIDDSLFGREWYDQSLLMSSDFYGDNDVSSVSRRTQLTPTGGGPDDVGAANVGADAAEAAPMSTGDHELTGRWQGLPVANQGALGFDKWPESNAWGRLTESWNTDSAKVVSRAQTLCDYETKAKLPGCAALQGALLMNSTTSFRRHIEFELHAEIHPAIGGAWRCSMPGGESLSLTQLEEDYPLAAGLVENLALNLNLFWRGMFNSSLNNAYPILCPRNGQCVDADPTSPDPELQSGTSPEDCICTCPRLDAKLANTTTVDEEFDAVYRALDESMFFILAAYKSQGTRISNYLEMDAASGRWYWLDNSGAPLDDDANKAVTILIGKLIFHPGHVAPFNGPLPGPNDPIFWPTHANAEHVWHYKRALATQNEWGSDLWDESWDVLEEDDDWYERMGCWGYPYDAKLPFTSLFGEGDGMSEASDAAPEGGAVRRLDESKDDEGDELENVVEQLSAKDHHDRIRDELIELAAGGRSGYTNRELHQKFHPWNPTLPFMYETFTWEHCGVGHLGK